MINKLPESLGEIGYEQYRRQAGYKSLVTGEPIPEFEKLDPKIKEAWEAAATAVEGIVRHWYLPAYVNSAVWALIKKLQVLPSREGFESELDTVVQLFTGSDGMS